MLRKIAAILVALTLLSVSAASAQNKSLYWQRWDVVIDNVDTARNQFVVTEIYDIQFSGSFTYGSAVIPTDSLSSITNVQVSEGGQALRESCGGQTGTYCVENTSDGLSITYYFSHRINSGSDHIELEYTVNGALRIYPDGDQLWWSAIPADHFGFPIQSSTITVKLPQGFAPREGVDPVVTYGAPGNVQVNGSTVVATATRQIGGDESFEIRVQYPHDPNAVAPSWQASYDQEAQLTPVISLIALVGSLAIAIGGTLFFYVLYRTKGRDPEIGPVPTYLSEPPSELPPAVVGTLVDERADPRDVISTVIDLAHRGYLAIEETQNEGVFGIGRSSEFTFKRTDKALDDLRGFESKLMNRLFGSDRMERTMGSLREKFYMVIAEIQGDLYQELVRDEFFSVSPNTTRATWAGIGVVIIALAVILGFLLFPLMDRFGILLILPPIAVGFVAVAALVVGPAMPAKTRKGAEEAAKWKAFYEYLRHLEKYASLEEAAAQFERYLPYSVAFGLDNLWINRFKAVPYVPVPYWYYPTYIGPYRRGYMAGTPLNPGFGGSGMPGGLAHAGGSGVSLDQMSGNLAGGLEGISGGLSQMLNSASSVMTSRPQAQSGSSGSWRSGGSHWSGGGGGGFGGGHSSGGGSRGFG